MSTDFKDTMSKRTDEELIRIVTLERDGYQPLAIEAAEDEITKRNIDTTKAENVRKDLVSMAEEQKQLDTMNVSSLVRFVHFIVDMIVVSLLTLVLFYVLVFFTTDQLVVILGNLSLATGFFGYYIFMETKYQKTIGKFITKTKVITKDGATPKSVDIVIRTFCRLIPFDHISYLFTANGIHDRFSDTMLIKDKSQ